MLSCIVSVWTHLPVGVVVVDCLVATALGAHGSTPVSGPALMVVMMSAPAIMMMVVVVVLPWGEGIMHNNFSVIPHSFDGTEATSKIQRILGPEALGSGIDGGWSSRRPPIGSQRIPGSPVEPSQSNIRTWVHRRYRVIVRWVSMTVILPLDAFPGITNSSFISYKMLTSLQVSSGVKGKEYWVKSSLRPAVVFVWPVNIFYKCDTSCLRRAWNWTVTIDGGMLSLIDLPSSRLRIMAAKTRFLWLGTRE